MSETYGPKQKYPDLTSHLMAIVERYGAVPIEDIGQDLRRDLGLDLPDTHEEVVRTCFDEFLPDFEYGEGDITFATSLDTVEELIQYFEDICESPRAWQPSDFHFNFSTPE